jgi:glutathione S-transferase
MDKVVAQIYETEMRPAEFQYEPWLVRVREQAAAGFDWLETTAVAAGEGSWLCGDAVTQADISTAVAWRFLELRAPDQLRPEDRPALAAFGRRAEALPEFAACPVQ